MEDLVKEIKEHNKDKIINDLKVENQELKEIIISMSKFMFSRDNALVETIKNIDKNLRKISRK